MNNKLLQAYLNQTLSGDTQASYADPQSVWKHLANQGLLNRGPAAAQPLLEGMPEDPTAPSVPNAELSPKADTGLSSLSKQVNLLKDYYQQYGDKQAPSDQKKQYIQFLNPMYIPGPGPTTDQRSVMVSDYPQAPANIHKMSSKPIPVIPPPEQGGNGKANTPPSLQDVLQKLKLLAGEKPGMPIPAPRNLEGGAAGGMSQAPGGVPQGDLQGRGDQPGALLGGLLGGFGNPAIQKALLELSKKDPLANPSTKQALQKLQQAAQNPQLQGKPEGKDFTPFSQMDLSPLMAYSDSINPGGKLLLGYTKPLGPNDIAQQQLANQVKQTEMAYKMGSLGVDQYKAKVEALKAANQARQVDPITRMQMGQAYIAHNTMLSKIAQDQQLQDYVKNARGLQDAINQIDWAAIETPTQLREAQAKIRASLKLGNNFSAEERKNLDLKAITLDWNDVKQYWYDEPMDAGENLKEWVKHLRDLAQIQIQNYKNHAQSQLNALTTGQEYNYSIMPQLYHDLESKKNAIMRQFDPAVLNPSNPQGERNKLEKDIRRKGLEEQFKEFKNKRTEKK